MVTTQFELAFSVAFRDLIDIEGGYVYDRQDPGGETRYGISKRQYPDVDIRALTLAKAARIYKLDYWDRLSLDRLPSKVAAEVFEVAVNAGHSIGVKCLQRALNFFGSGLKVDGKLGPRTISKINRIDELLLLTAQNCEQYNHFKRVQEGRHRRGLEPHRYSAGWMKRVSII